MVRPSVLLAHQPPLAALGTHNSKTSRSQDFNKFHCVQHCLSDSKLFREEYVLCP